MKLERLSLGLLDKAISIYWERAYAQTTGGRARPQFSLSAKAAPEDVLSLFQREEVEVMNDRPRIRYTMRLGNRNYPFMKLLLQEHILEGEYFFAVDTHDEMGIKPEYPDYEAWNAVRQFNSKLKREIEEGFTGAGLETAAMLRQMVCERTSKGGNARNRSILVVDDEEDLADTVESLLRAQGYRVFKVHDGRSGLRAARELHPDLVLMDYELPELDGLEVIHLLREDETTRGIPILLTTASRVTMEDIASAEGFLAKPFSESLLYEVVGRLLGAPEETP
ncbi:MAG: response regulator [Planctomycetota bacterium]|jgi:two-component system cell cycle response regulator DivK